MASYRKGWLSAAGICLIAVLLSGCWDKLEINDWAFVQAVAIDLSKDGRIRLTNQIYKPGSTDTSSMSPSTGASFFNVSTENGSIYGASLVASNEIGRKLQWSHMETLIISEAFARERNIGEVLDFFSRSNDPKSTLTVVIAKGEASSYLNAKPLVENSIGKQLASSIENAHMNTGASLIVTLTELSILAKQQSATFVIPFLPSMGTSVFPRTPTFALLRFPEGKLIDVVPVSKAPYLLMLLKRYRNGLVNIPCGNAQEGDQRNESFRIESVHSKIKPMPRQDHLTVRIEVEVSGSVKELVCSSIITESEVEKFTGKIAGKIEKQLSLTIDYLQAEEADILGVGEHLHRWHNGLWKSWQKDWGERFKQALFEINVHVRLSNTGVDAGRPYTSE